MGVIGHAGSHLWGTCAQDAAGVPWGTTQSPSSLGPPRQGHLGMAQLSPPNLPSPLPMRSPGISSPSNMPLDHLLMLTNLTNNQNEDWVASPHAGNPPSINNTGNCSPGAFHVLLVPLLPIAILHVCTTLVSAQKHHQTDVSCSLHVGWVTDILCVTCGGGAELCEMQF